MPLDFMLIGWPRSGTSSLFNWLNAHPNLQGSTPKELFFFMDLEHPLCGIHGSAVEADGLGGYQRFFPEEAEGRLRFEATTHTFYQRLALRWATDAINLSLVGAVLRRPADRIRSSFLFTQENLGAIHRELTFATYVEWLLAGEIERARPYYRSASSYWIAARELELSRYVEWLDKWQKAVGSDRLEVMLFDGLKVEPRQIVGRIAERLKIDVGFYEDYDFTTRNQTVTIRNQRLHLLARIVGSRLPASLIKRSMKDAYYGLQLNSAPSGVQSDDQNALQRLDEYFQPWNRALAERFKLDLSVWEKNRQVLPTKEASDYSSSR